MNNRPAIPLPTEKLYLPSNWNSQEMAILLDLSAGRAFLLDQFGVDVDSTCSQFFGDKLVSYYVFADDSVWAHYMSSAQDFVVSSVEGFLAHHLLPKIKSEGTSPLWPADRKFVKFILEQRLDRKFDQVRLQQDLADILQLLN